MSAFRFTPACVALLLVGGRAAAQDRVVNPHVTVTLIPATMSAVPGQRLPVALHFTLEPGWYIYWRNPGQGGIAPRVAWTLPAGWAADTIAWPVPERYDVADVTTHIHRGPVVLGSGIRVPPAARGRARLAAELSYGVCREVCLPGSASLSLALAVEPGTMPNGDWTRLAPLLAARAPKPGGPRASARVRDSTAFITLRHPSGGPLTPRAWTFFPSESEVSPAAVTATARPGARELILSLPLADCTPVRLRGVLVEGDGRTARPVGYAVNLPVGGGKGCPSK